MDEVISSEPMVHTLKDTSRTTFSMGKAGSSSLLAQSTTAASRTKSTMALVLTPSLMEPTTQESTIWVQDTAAVSSRIQMAKSTTANSTTRRSKAGVFTPSKTEGNTRASSQITSNQERVL